ncbi:hypothetical protein QE152_g5208 [Popillia japonica]|uniref:Uncharacterized protein n=1 Tax=Popillia japonica TaxID=7064 RepID=A0AAW1MTQ6_POPJA
MMANQVETEEEDIEMMDQRKTEKGLAIAYFVSILLGATAAITIGVSWGHWMETLDHCGNLGGRRNCSCILYGRNTLTYFQGGGVPACAWVTFGPLTYMFFSACLACFHGFRVCFGSNETKRRTIKTRNEAGEMVILQTMEVNNISRLPRGFWITTSMAFLTPAANIGRHWKNLYGLMVQRYLSFIDGYLVQQYLILWITYTQIGQIVTVAAL